MTYNFHPSYPERLVIHSTTDTQQRDPLTGKPMSGTGETMSCNHCGKAIQVHTNVAVCLPVKKNDIVIGYRPIDSTVIIGKDCAKRLNALDRHADRCNFKWVTE